MISFLAVLGSKNGLLFPSLYLKKRFGQSLHSVLKWHYHEYQALGAFSEDLVTHSVQIVPATYCCCIVHPGPPIVSVCLKAGWTVRRVKERYLKHESAGDQLSLTGINPQSGEFSTWPCFFFSLNQEKREKVEQLAKYCFSSQNQSFSHTKILLLAIFLHNEQWLKGDTHENSLLK